MVTVYQSRPITDAVLASLNAGGILVGDGVKPVGGGWSGTAGASTFVPYIVLYSMPVGTIDGPLMDPQADVEARYSINAVGMSRKQTDTLADKARIVMLSTAVNVTGRTVLRIAWLTQVGIGRDDESDPPIWVAADRYAAMSTPT